jgi:hypothetical protein
MGRGVETVEYNVEVVLAVVRKGTEYIRFGQARVVT